MIIAAAAAAAVPIGMKAAAVVGVIVVVVVVVDVVVDVVFNILYYIIIPVIIIITHKAFFKTKHNSLQGHAQESWKSPQPHQSDLVTVRKNLRGNNNDYQSVVKNTKLPKNVLNI